MVDENRYKTGFLCMADALERRDAPAPHKVINDLFQTRTSQAAADTLSGALNLLLGGFIQLRGHGKIPRYANKTVDAFMHQGAPHLNAYFDIGLARNSQEAADRLGWICGAMEPFRGKIECRLRDTRGKLLIDRRPL